MGIFISIFFGALVGFCLAMLLVFEVGTSDNDDGY
jgi:hypothetical protein